MVDIVFACVVSISAIAGIAAVLGMMIIEREGSRKVRGYQHGSKDNGT